MEDIFTQPAEWVEQECVWLAWPKYASVRGRPSSTAILEIVQHLINHVRVALLINDANTKSEVFEHLKSIGTDEHLLNNVTFHDIEHTDIWMRDVGPIFLKGKHSFF